MASLQEILKRLKERWSALGLRARIGIAIGAALVVGLGVLLVARGSETSFGLLYSNLSSDDAARIVEKLRENHVEYKLESGTEIWVPEVEVHETRLTLAGEGLPSGGGVGFEIFDEQRFGESEFSEQVKYHRALEGELSRTINHIAGVESARVHLVLPNRTLFAVAETTASASVALKLKPGFRMRDEQVSGIVHLVASSVRGLAPERVTVVDGDGRSLSRADEADGELATDSLTFRHELEHSKENAIQELLDRTLGPGTAVVRVAADVSFAREERTEEQFDPETIAQRSFQITEERDSSSGPSTAGVPGAASNLPGGEAPSAGSTSGNANRRSETRNFEVSKVVRRAIEPVGRLKRLQVAVVVDGRWRGQGATRHFTSRDASELGRIKSIVESAAGVQADRGDSVTVDCVPFADSAHPRRAPKDPLAKFRPYMPFAPYAAGVLGALLLLVIWGIARRRARKARQKAAKAAARAQALQPASAVALGLAGSVVGGLVGAGDPAAALAAAVMNEPRLAEAGSAIAAAALSPQVIATELASRDPDLAARVVRGWLSEGRP